MYTYTFDEVKANLAAQGYYLDILEEDYKGVTISDLICHDDKGYKYKIVYDQVMSGHFCRPVISSNKYSIYNINMYLKNNNVDFVCISDEYKSKKSLLEFVCGRCGEHVFTTWDRINRNDNPNRNHIVCPSCGKKKESLHALVLKQMFIHNYDDTVVEDKTYRSSVTGKICPTDIVNHRLKIAVEIQSEFHDRPDIAIKDEMKKKFWVDRGYTFYALDIREYTVLDMCRVFFDIDSIPDYIDYTYSDCINLRAVQNMLESGMSIPDICKELNISKHQVYDAKASGKIHYPDDYIPSYQTPISQYTIDWKHIKDYRSIKDAAIENNISSKNISSALASGRTFSGGFNWLRSKSA